MANFNNKALTTVELCSKAITDPFLSKSYRINDLIIIRDNYAKACSTPEQLILFLKAARKFGVSIERGEIHAQPAGGYVERTLPNGKKNSVWVDAVVPVIDYKVYTRKLASKGIYIKSAVVYKNDDFEFDYVLQAPSKHKATPRGDRGPIVGAWANTMIPETKQVHGVYVPWGEAVRERDEYIDGRKTGRKVGMAKWATTPEFMMKKAAIRQLATQLSEEFKEYPDDSTFNPVTATAEDGAIETSFTVNEDESAGDDNNSEPEPEPQVETGPPELPAEAVAACNDIVNLVNDIIAKSELPLPPPATLNLVAKHDDSGQGAWANVNAVATKTASIDAVKEISKYKTLRKGLRELLATLTATPD